MPDKLLKAEKLRAEAKRLEDEAEMERIYTECYFSGYRWHRDGKCYSVWSDKEYCKNHEEPYTDEYSMWQYCYRCKTHNGEISVEREVREPEWDAPKPPEGKPTYGT